MNPSKNPCRAGLVMVIADSDPNVDFDEGRSLLSLLFYLITLSNINYFLRLLTFCLQTEARFLVNSTCANANPSKKKLF
jgi:hypothetical protein